MKHMTAKDMTAEALNWWHQEMEMVRNRVKLHLKRPAWSGNPMTARHAISHLHFVKRCIQTNPELYA